MAEKLYFVHSVRFKYIWFNILSIAEISIDFTNAGDSGQ